jgi:hypothetical protein
MNEDTKTIRVQKVTFARLAARCRKQQTFDTAINVLLSIAEEVEKQRKLPRETSESYIPEGYIQGEEKV